MKTLVLAVIALFATVASAQSDPIQVSEPRTVRIGIVAEEPFFIEGENGSMSGFDAEVLSTIGDTANWQVEVVHFDRFADLFTALQGDNQIDGIMNGITINLEREQIYDFSQPYMNTGLGIMIAEESNQDFVSSIQAWIEVRIPLIVNLLVICALFLAALCVFGFLLYITDDQRKQDANDDDGLTFMEVMKGSANSVWLAFTTGSTIGYGDVYPKRVAARIVAVLCFFCVAILVSSLTASITSFNVVQQFEARIDGPSDLKGKKIAVVSGTTSVDEVEFYKGIVREYDNYDQCIAALIMGRVEAVVGDVPNLAFFANGEGQDVVVMADTTFAPQNYGIAFRQGSPLVEQANLAILASQDEIKEISMKYFGH